MPAVSIDAIVKSWRYCTTLISNYLVQRFTITRAISNPYVHKRWGTPSSIGLGILPNWSSTSMGGSLVRSLSFQLLGFRVVDDKSWLADKIRQDKIRYDKRTQPYLQTQSQYVKQQTKRKQKREIYWVLCSSVVSRIHRAYGGGYATCVCCPIVEVVISRCKVVCGWGKKGWPRNSNDSYHEIQKGNIGYVWLSGKRISNTIG